MCRAKLQPKVSNIRLVTTVGVHLRHLVDEIPGFGALVVTLTKPPKLSYSIDTGGAVVGKAVGTQVENFLATLLPNILNGFLVWPERLVIPITPEETQPPLTDLMLRHQGIMKVRSMRCARVYSHGYPRCCVVSWLLCALFAT